ncbi:MAG: diguanylate cyclase domain-containing protein [Oscillospiraceae bacterium]
MKKTYRIAVVAEKLFDDFTWGVLHGVFAQAKQEGIALLVVAPNNPAPMYAEHFQGECNIYRAIPFDAVDAVLYIPTQSTDSPITPMLCQLLQEKCHVPCITVGRAMNDWDYVATDTDAQIQMLLHHMTVYHGYSALGVMTDHTRPDESERFRRLIAENAECPVTYFKSNGTDGEIRALGEQMLRGEVQRPRAMLFSHDAMAIAFCDTMAAGGMQIPQDIAIAGFGASLQAAYHIPKIASVSRPLHQAGVEAVVRLLARCRNIQYTPWDITTDIGSMECGTTCGCSELDMAFPMMVFRRKKTVDDSMAAFSNANVMVSLECAENLMQFQQTLTEKSYVLNNVTRYALCLCMDWDAMEDGNAYRTEGYSEMMQVSDASGIPIVFPLSQLLPPSMRNDAATVDFILPLHFNARCYGYAVMRMDEHPELYNQVMASWNECICNGLEFIRVRNHLMRVSSRLSFSAVRDPFTGLFDRQAISQFLQQYAAQAAQTHTYLMLTALDIDYLTYINNQYGYAEGDTLILNIAKLLSTICTMNQTCFRLDGGRFLVIGVRDTEQDCRDWHKQLDLQVREYNQINGLPYAVSLSLGKQVIQCSGETRLQEMITDVMVRCDRKQEEVRKRSALPHYMELLLLRKAIYAAPQRRWNIDEMCNEVYLSRTYFQTIYHKFFGVSCKQDVTDSKMICAKRLLRTTNASIAEIAEQCAYDNVTSFLRRFKQCTGFSPDQFRRMMQAV